MDTTTDKPKKQKGEKKQKTPEELAKEKADKAEKARQKELKKKQMQEACKPKQATAQIKKVVKYKDNTIPGEKKDFSQPMPETYDPAYVESAWDAWWQKKEFFKVNVNESAKQQRNNRFIMLLPPPNVTGSLHLGHTLMGAIEDSIVRYKRLKGFSSLWVPGTDHAGIATQSVVEKQLLKECGKYRTDYTRKDFVDKVWDWKKKYGDRIMEQFRRLGVSFDLSRYFFTMDEMRGEGVKEAFIQLYERGKLYRAKRMVNWCCALQTAISDVEIEDLEIDKPTMLSIPMHDGKYEFGVLIDFAYRFKDDPTREIIVSTTRIETMLGDTAVAVHPEDERYKDLIGKELIHPFFPQRVVKIIADPILVDKEFGTGAVKITPAHDPNDFLCGQRNGLEFVNIFNDDGTLNENGGEFKGMKRYDCRNAIIKRLDEMKLYKGKHPNKMVLQKCSKTSDIIEPMVKAQWWIDCKEVAKRTIDDVNSGKLKIIPEFQKQTLFGFLDNIRDWCISRQLWWGHQCPIYLVTIKGILDNPDPANNDHWVAAKNEAEAINKASIKFKCEDKSLISVKQDDDVLDTWFSSSLLPLTCFGWPNVKDNEEFKTFFPTDLLETGHDIIFFWVARMVFMSYFFMDTVPFHTVFLHPIVKDSQGRKMSKSLGNVVDPIEVIDGTTLEKLIEAIKAGNLPKHEVDKSVNEKKKEFPEGIPECGADALRLGLMSYLVQGKNINLDISRVVSYRFFGNKLWNAIKFLLIYTSKDFTYAPIDRTKLTFIDKWILNKLSRTIQSFEKNFDEYNFGEATNKIYSFWYYNICDVYIEALKFLLSDSCELSADIKNNTKNVFLYCIEQALILLHPLTPFITEELFQRLPHRNSTAESICVASFPTDVSYIDDKVETIGDLVLDITHGGLSVLSQFKIQNSKPKMCIYSTDKEVVELVKKESGVIAALARCCSVSAVDNKEDENVKGWLSNVINSTVDIYLDIKDKIDIKKEIVRLEGTLVEKRKFESGIRNKMEKKEYEEKVPEHIRKEDAEKLNKMLIEIGKVEESIANLKKLE